jgi:endonuclease/exonuclease/phosphatase family metal-dependent hydrolase
MVSANATKANARFIMRATMSGHLAALLALIASAGLAGCDDGGGGSARDGGSASDADTDATVGSGDGGTGPDAAPPRTFSAITFNVGLARGFVPYAEERVAPAAAAIAALDADIICLQEVWEPADVAAVTAAARDRYPHSFSEPADPGVCGACGVEEADTLEACVRERCPDDLEDPVGCALSACEAEVNAISESCLVCLSANIGGSLDNLLLSCAGETAACFAYGGSYGTLLLSKRPLEAAQLSSWPSSINRRGVLSATIGTDPTTDPVDAASMQVYCTHLSAIFSDIPFPGEGPDGDSPAAWAAEQRAQIVALRDQIDREAGERPVLLLGDFNTGPAVPANDVEAEYIENYEVLVEGFTAPFVVAPGICTYCSDENPLIGGGVQGGNGGVLIDHALLRGVGTEVAIASSRVLDTPITLQTSAGAVDSRYSDHYGVEVKLTAP